MFRSQKSEVRSQKSEVRILLCLFLLLTSNLYGLELVRQKNVATYIVFPIVDADGDIVTSAAALDSEIDTWSDGAAPDGFGDCTNATTEIGSTGIYYLLLTQGEMNVDYVYVQIKTSTSGAKTQHILVRTIIGDPLNIATTDDGGTINVTAGKIDEVSALTSHTAQSGDSYAIVLANLDVVLSDVNEVLDTEDPNVWYVAKTGSDTNGGNRRNDALLTITQAVTNAQSGDKIIIAPGTYTGDIDASAKELSFVSSVRRAAIIQGDTDYALRLDDNSTVTGMQCISVDAGGGMGIFAQAKKNIRITDCYCWGYADGVNASGAEYLTIEDCYIKSKYDGLLMDGGKNKLLNTNVEITGEVGGDVHTIKAGGSQAGDAQILENVIIRATKTAADAGTVIALNIAKSNVILKGVSIVMELGADASGDAKALYISGGTYPSKVFAHGVVIRTVVTHESSNAYDIDIAANQEIVMSGCLYDPSKVTGAGTVTQMSSGWAAAVNAEADTALDTAIPGSPTANSINDRLTAVLADTALWDTAAEAKTLLFGEDANGLTEDDLATIVDAIHDEVVEGTITMRQAMRLYLAVLTGKSTGGGTTTINFRDIADAKNRVTATVDINGNRTAVTRTAD